MKYLLFISTIVGLFWSCSKDESTNPNNDSLSGKLHKMVMFNASNTDTIEFKYDDNGKVINMFIGWPNTECGLLSIVRNSSGQITSFNYQELASHGTVFHYTIGTDGKYKSAQITVNDLGNITEKSEVYTYTGNHISQTDFYKNNVYTSKILFTYDNQGNIIKREYYNTTGHKYSKKEFTYDNKVNPIESLDVPFFLSDMYDPSTSTNNLLTIQINDEYNTSTESYTYSYNNSRKPITADYSYQYSSGTSGSSSIKYIYY